MNIEEQLRDSALRPQDEAFTRRVLSALPPGSPSFPPVMRRSFALATRVGLVLVLLAAAQRWYSAGSGSLDTILAIFLFFVPTLAATSWLCGPWFSRRNWL